VKAWSLEKRGDSILDHWQAKLRHFRRLSKDWSANFESAIRKQKKTLMKQYDLLDIKSET
jgi:hypothetical protein